MNQPARPRPTIIAFPHHGDLVAVEQALAGRRVAAVWACTDHPELVGPITLSATDPAELMRRARAKLNRRRRTPPARPREWIVVLDAHHAKTVATDVERLVQSGQATVVLISPPADR